MIDGSTKILGVIGHNIPYTLSPSLHNAAIASLGLNACYLPFDCSAAGLRPLLASMWDCGALGFNITKPYKASIPMLVGTNTLQAANTLYRGSDTWLAASTDGPGFVAALSQISKSLSDFHELVFIGHGGAVTAISEHLQLVAPGLRIKALSRRQQSATDIESLSLTALTFATIIATSSAKTLLVHASSAPQAGDRLDWLLPFFSTFKGSFIDLNYGPAQVSALLPAALAAGYPCSDGIPMLIEQARLSQELWWGQSAPYTTMNAAIVQSL